MIYQNDQQDKPYNFWKRLLDLEQLFKFPYELVQLLETLKPYYLSETIFF